MCSKQLQQKPNSDQTLVWLIFSLGKNLHGEQMATGLENTKNISSWNRIRIHFALTLRRLCWSWYFQRGNTATHRGLFCPAVSCMRITLETPSNRCCRKLVFIHRHARPSMCNKVMITFCKKNDLIDETSWRFITGSALWWGELSAFSFTINKKPASRNESLWRTSNNL